MCDVPVVDLPCKVANYGTRVNVLKYLLTSLDKLHAPHLVAHTGSTG